MSFFKRVFLGLALLSSLAITTPLGREIVQGLGFEKGASARAPIQSGHRQPRDPENEEAEIRPIDPQRGRNLSVHSVGGDTRAGTAGSWIAAEYTVQVTTTPREMFAGAICKVTALKHGALLSEEEDGSNPTSQLRLLPDHEGYVTFYYRLPRAEPSGRVSQIRVTAENASSVASLDLKARCADGMPRHDNFASAKTLSDPQGQDVDTNIGATREASEPEPKDTGGASVWYRWIAPRTAKYKFTTWDSGFDTHLAIFSGSKLEALELEAFDDDDSSDVSGFGISTVAFNATAGSTYHLQVSGNRGEQNLVSLRWQQIPAPPNDSFESPMQLAAGGGVLQGGSTAGCTGEVGEPMHDDLRGGSSAWYRWTPPAAGLVEIKTTGSTFPTIIAVYAGKTLAGLKPVAAHMNPEDSFDSVVKFVAEADTTYLIAIDGNDAQSGNFTLSYGVAQP